MSWLSLLTIIYAAGVLITLGFIAWMLFGDGANRVGPWWQDIFTSLGAAVFWPVTVPFLIYLIVREKEPV